MVKHCIMQANTMSKCATIEGVKAQGFLHPRGLKITSMELTIIIASRHSQYKGHVEVELDGLACAIQS
jgi:hypothetical protein